MKETIQKQSPYLMPGAIVIAGAMIAGAAFLTQENGQQQEPSPLPGDETILGDINIELEGWPTMGSPDAPVTIVEYSDFACPFCKRFAEETKPLIKRDYIDTGKVRFVFKDFVVAGGNMAAEAAHCAAEQGKFWEYHALLFSRQTQDRAQWSNSSVHRGYANELGLDATALIECFESRKYQEKVARSTEEAARNGGEGTPFFLINEQPIFGAHPYSVFQQVIDSLLIQQ